MIDGLMKASKKLGDRFLRPPGVPALLINGGYRSCSLTILKYDRH